ncbi:sigma-70 family RNA polymerase sigma factor [Flavobacterium amnicola]|uniref:Sigma-70 family RNA polymerase sigma factor n=1 Tax=Flavobacterium amnicola TaxID=2506422 RepID=A0A4Q1K5N5_9FLAO|nr:sigma-70 family RNA polymerase sigma factor [Flavobacterium amnicola]RXR21108.1 sigma-70 family RNA polymerase sigma factor [Flavobacterium amnicola]
MSLPLIIKGCIEKDTKSQAQLYQLYAGKLFAVCLKYSKNYAEAQDNLQEGFLLIFDKIEQYSQKGSFDGWAKRLMINYVLQQYRKTVFLELVNDVVDDANIEIEDDNLSLEFLLKLVQELPDRYRLVFNLYVLDDYSHKEIAEMLGISTGTSKSNLARAKMILKDKIDGLNQNNIPSVK